MVGISNYTRTTVEQKIDSISGRHKNELFYKCEFPPDLRGLTLEKCNLLDSKFTTETLEQMRDFTVTLDCFTFNRIELTPLMFDALLTMLLKTRGNTEKRRKILDVLGHERVLEIGKMLEALQPHD